MQLFGRKLFGQIHAEGHAVDGCGPKPWCQIKIDVVEIGDAVITGIPSVADHIRFVADDGGVAAAYADHRVVVLGADSRFAAVDPDVGDGGMIVACHGFAVDLPVKGAAIRNVSVNPVAPQ